MQINPFQKIRFRSLVGYAILTFIATLLSLILLERVLPEWFKSSPSPLRDALSSLLLYLFFSLFTVRMLFRAGLSYNQLFGKFLGGATLRLYSLWAVPLIIFSIAFVYLLYLPLSFLFPGFVQWWFLDFSPALIWTEGNKYVTATLLNLFTVVLIAPILEEFFFRGILLTRWTLKWGVAKAIIATSVIFGFLHINPISGFCFGCVMAVFYIRTKSLFIPISVHIANNGIAWIMEFVIIQFDNSPSPQTITEFRESWWVGLLALVISIPCVFQFWRRYIPQTDWRVPYLSESTDCESNTTR